MWQQELIWFFAIFHHEFRKNNPIAFEVLMVLAIAHLFGFYNPKQLADFLDLPHQKFYAELDPRAHLRRNLRFRPPENSWRLYEPDFDFLDEFFGRFLTPNSLLSEP